MAVYAIGDIQGCFRPLQRLLEVVDFDPRRDRLLFTGDLVNRGPESLAVLRYVRALGDRAEAVLGNHDLHLLAVWTGHNAPRRKDSLRQVLDAPDADELMDWLRCRPLLHEETALGWLLVHAGVYPQWDLNEARQRAREVEQALRGPNFRDYFAYLYGNRPDRWSPDLAGWDRLRFITNAFTRMRYCDPDGRLLLEFKGAPEDAPDDHIPWFRMPGRPLAADPMQVVCGHWSTLGWRDESGVHSIDTGCLWGGGLTALRLDGDAERFTLPCAAYMEPGPGR